MLDRIASFLYSCAWWLAILIILVVVCLYIFQNKLIYQPTPMGLNLPPTPDLNPPGYRSPLERGIDFEEFYLTTSDNIKIHTWLMKTRKASDAPTIIFYHENAGNFALRMDSFENFVKELEVNVFAVSYRGYGFSQGSPSENGIYRDADCVMKFIFEEAPIDRKKVFLFGRSLGGATSIYSAWKFQEFPIRGMIIENTFTSLDELVDHIMPYVSYFKSFLLANHWPSAERIKTLTLPILFISGLQDELIPCEHMKRLHDLAINSKSKTFYTVKDGDHNMTWRIAGEAYIPKLKEFVEKCLAIKD